jgi:hypothetical protein
MFFYRQRKCFVVPLNSNFFTLVLDILTFKTCRSLASLMDENVHKQKIVYQRKPLKKNKTKFLVFFFSNEYIRSLLIISKEKLFVCFYPLFFSLGFHRSIFNRFLVFQFDSYIHTFVC